MSKELFVEYVQKYNVPLHRSIRTHREEIDLIQNSLIDNKEFIVEKSLNFDKELLKFYSVITKWKVHWRTKESSNVQLEGTFNILPIEDVAKSDFESLSGQFPVLKNFTMLDYFYPEACVGFYLDKPENGLYLHLFEGETHKLNLDFKGYLEMLKYTKGAAYWQNSLVEPVVRTSSRAIEALNQIFPEVTVEGFYKLYDSLRMDK